MRTRNTLEELGLWKQLYSHSLKPIEFDRFLHEAGTNAFTLSPQIEVNTKNTKAYLYDLDMTWKGGTVC